MDDDVDARVVEPAAVPATAAELFAFLQAGSYLDFVTESGPHPSAGPHGGTVRAFLNPVLAASLASGGPHDARPSCAWCETVAAGAGPAMAG